MELFCENNQVRVKGLEILFFWKILRTFLMDGSLIVFTKKLLHRCLTESLIRICIHKSEPFSCKYSVKKLYFFAKLS